ncbi:MAG: hypothetical protein ABR598_03005 [Candidatus Dormibacteria bacterium]
MTESPPGALDQEASWREILVRHVGAEDDRVQAGVAAALAAKGRGAKDEVALREGRRAAGLYPHPGTVLYRNPVRVALLLLVSSGFYQLWWLWETFALGVRERFPHGRSLPWILIPIYNLVVIYRNADDLRRAETHYAGSSGLQPWLILILIAAGLVTSRVFGLLGLAALPLLAAAGYMNQLSINRYLVARYPDARPRISSGEIFAAVIGIGLTVLIVIGLLART